MATVSLKWMTRVRSGDAVANWLWAYWLLREYFTTDCPDSLFKVREKVGQRKEQ